MRSRNEKISQLTAAQRVKRWFWRKFDKTIEHEDIRGLPDLYTYLIGGLVTFSYLMVFVYFFATGLQAQLNTVYLSPVGSSDSGNLNLNPITNPIPTPSLTLTLTSTRLMHLCSEGAIFYGIDR